MMDENKLRMEMFNDRNRVADYEKRSASMNWHGPEIAFGMSYDLLKSGDSVLDVGIGTGLSAQLFKMAGARVYGMDASAAMIELCLKKNIAEEIKQHDMFKQPYPFEDKFFDLIVCTGVFHMVDDLSPVFREISRMLKKDGVFTFTVMDRDETDVKVKKVVIEDVNGQQFSFHRYSQKEVIEMLSDCGIGYLKSVQFYSDHAENKWLLRCFVGMKK